MFAVSAGRRRRFLFLLFAVGAGNRNLGTYCTGLPGLALEGPTTKRTEQQGKQKRLPYSVVGRCRDSWAVLGYSSTVGILCGRALQG